MRECECMRARDSGRAKKEVEEERKWEWMVITLPRAVSSVWYASIVDFQSGNRVSLGHTFDPCSGRDALG